MSEELPRYVWRGNRLYRTRYVGDITYLNALMGDLCMNTLTHTIWFVHAIKPNGEFDTGTPIPEEAHSVVLASGKLEGWL